MFKPSDEEEMQQPVVRCEARTQRELLEAAGVDATGVVAVLRRTLCRGSRGRNIAFALLALLSVLLATTSRSDDRKPYLYAPSKAYAEDSHLESVHWTHFHKGAPVIVVVRDIATFLNTAMFVGPALDQESGAGTPWIGTGSTARYRMKQLQECIVARITEANRTSGTVSAVNATANEELLAYDENGFPIDAKDSVSLPSNDTNDRADDVLRVRVLPVLTGEGVVGPATAMFRRLPWSRLVLVLTNESAIDAPSVMCLTALRTSAIIGVHGDWFATHGGLAPPHRVHHVSVALPLRGLSAAKLADLASRHDATTLSGAAWTSRFSLFFAPASAAGDAGDRPGSWTWWAAKRILHTAPSEGVVVVAPDSHSATSPSSYSTLDDAVLSRLHHEHIQPSTNASVIVATHTVRLTSELGVVAPLTNGMGPLTRPSQNALLLTVRPDGFGVFRCPDVTLAAKVSAEVHKG